MYSKIQKEWSQQSEPFKEELHAHILRILEGWVQGSSEQSTPVAIPQNAIQRLCLAFAAMAVLTPALVDSYIEKTKAMLTLAFDQAQGRTQSIGNSTAPAFNNSGVSLNVSNGNQVDHNGGGGQAASVEEAVTSVADRAFFVAAELLRVLPEEKEQVHPPDVSALLPDGIENSLRTSVPKVVELIQVRIVYVCSKATCLSLRLIPQISALDDVQVYIPRDAMLQKNMDYCCIPSLFCFRGFSFVHIIASRLLQRSLHEYQLFS